MSFRIKQKNTSPNKHHISSSFASLGNKTKVVVARSRGFFLYPKLVTLLILVTVGLITTRIYFSNQLAVSGERVSMLQNQANEIKQDNYQLENEISQKSSLSYIETKANEMGMIRTDRLEVVKPIVPVAFKP